jgi:hypothetical protein
MTAQPIPASGHQALSAPQVRRFAALRAPAPGGQCEPPGPFGYMS